MPAPRPRRSTSASGPAGRLGPLHGVPVGVKDIIDTARLPDRERHASSHAGRRPRTTPRSSSRLRAAGAVILGKTVTTELACFTPGQDPQPARPRAARPAARRRGSAAAVAAGMVPLAIGTQTNGSVIRPASFCGVVGFKPSYGLIPRTGVLTTSAHARPCRRLRPLASRTRRSSPRRWPASTTATPRPGPCRRRRCAAWLADAAAGAAAPRLRARPGLGARPSPPRARRSPSSRRRWAPP